MGTMNRNLSAVFVVAALFLAGCSSSGAPEIETTQEEATTQGEVTVQEEPQEPSSDGSEESPWPLGTPVKVGDWELTVNSWQPNVNAAVEAAGDDLSMLPPGEQYALLNVTMTWNGEGAGDNSAVNLQYMPTGGNRISSSWEAFGTTPGDNKLAFEELMPGGSVTGDMLYSVDAGNADGVFMVIGKTVDEVQYLAAS